MQFYPADYVADTRHLTPAQHGAYLLLICEYWVKGSLPQDDRTLARIVGMTSKEWAGAKNVVQGFFHDGWQHKRIDAELAKAKDKHERRQEAGKRGGIASANSKQSPSNATSNAQASSSEPEPEKKDSEPIGSGAEAPTDHRKRLFDEGLPKLARLTGKGPDACRSFVGKCLKAAGDDAVTVLGLIEEAERNQAVDPSAWIVARLKPVEISNGKQTVHAAARDFSRQLQALNEPAPGLCESEGRSPVRLLPSR